MRLGGPLARNIAAFGLCCCLEEGFDRQLAAGLVSPSFWLSERIFLEGSLRDHRFVRLPDTSIELLRR
jgi:hypothetical protein